MRFSHLSDWLTWQESLHPTAIDLGLERLHRTLQRLQWRAPNCPVMTVGGTNGKGSTVVLARRILSEAGYRVGTFTSPHLIRYNERITIAEQEVSDASLIAAFERIDAARGTETLTFFEFNTLAALLAFETAGLDVMLLEVGMGGRLDAVNVVDADVSVITSVACDHCEWLGDDVEAIGTEKAGIMRAGRPTIFGSLQVPRSVERAAKELGSDLRQLGREFRWEKSAHGWNWFGRTAHYDALPAPALLGDIQFDNAASVLAALEALADRLPIERGAIDRALRTVALPGRFQIIDCEVEWILDVAHNPAAAHTLAQQLRALPERAPHSGATVAVCGILGDKDLHGIYREMQTSFDAWVVAGIHSSRALPAEELARRLADEGANVLDVHPDVPSACERALAAAGANGRVVVFGSFLTVGPALQWLHSRCVTLT